MVHLTFRGGLLLAALLVFGSQGWAQSAGGKMKVQDDVAEQLQQDMIEKLTEEGKWVEKKAPHFRLLTNHEDAKVLDAVAKETERMFDAYKAALNLDKTFAPTGVILFFKSQASYISHGGSRSSGGFYDPPSRVLVSFLEKEKLPDFFYRAGAIQLLDLTFPGAMADQDGGRIPPWILEGLIDAFGCTEINGTAVAFNSTDTLLAMKNLVAAQAAFEDISLKELLHYDAGEFSVQKSKAGPLAWSFCTFLWTAGPDKAEGGKGPAQIKYRPVMDRLIQAFRDGKSRKEAYAVAFEKLDLGQIEKEWQDHIGKLAVPAEVRLRQTMLLDALKEDGGWQEKETPHYRIFTNSSDESVLGGMAKSMELMFDAYQSAFKPDKPVTEKAIVIVHRTSKDYYRAGGPGGSGAFYSPASRVLVGYVEKETLLNYFYHEGTHQFFDLAFPGAFEVDEKTGEGNVPTWFSEGIADCFGASEIKGSTIMFNSLSSKLGEGRLDAAKRALERRDMTLQELLAFSKDEFYDRSTEAYPLAWSFCYFLWNWPNDSGDNRGQLRPVIAKLVKAFKEGKSRKEAYAYAFDKLDADSLDRNWRNYMLKVRTKKPK